MPTNIYLDFILVGKNCLHNSKHDINRYFKADHYIENKILGLIE